MDPDEWSTEFNVKGKTTNDINKTKSIKGRPLAKHVGAVSEKSSARAS